MRPSDFRPLLLACALFFGSAVTATAASLTLAWDPPTDGITAGYVIVYGTAPGVYTSRLDVGMVTTRRIDGLANGTRYYFRVQAYTNVGALSDFSAEVSGQTSGTASGGGGSTGGGSTGGGGATGGAAPGAGSSVSAGATGAQGPATSAVAFMRDGRFIDITWAPLAGTTDYRVEVGSQPGQTSFSATTNSTAITFDSTDLPSAAYYIRVRGIVGGVPGSVSNEEVVPGTGFARLDASTDAAGGGCADAPGAPRRFNAGAEGANVQLSWQPGNGSSASSFVLQVGSAPGLQNLMVVPMPGSQYGLSATAAFGSYALRLIATNDCGSSVWGAESILNVGGVSSSAPANVAAPGAPQAFTQSVAGTLVTLSWAAPVSGGPVTRYLIEATIADGTVVASLDTGTSATTFSHPNTPAGQYFVTVRAGNAAGFGPPSTMVTVTVP
jgi:hypothetical protein